MVSRGELIRRARVLRKNMTPAEVLLWSRLKGKQIDGHKFRRQHILYPHIVDFYCAPERLVVEVDGPYHVSPTDIARDEYLKDEYDVEVLRFDNLDVELSLDEVLQAIRTELVGGGG